MTNPILDLLNQWIAPKTWTEMFIGIIGKGDNTDPRKNPETREVWYYVGNETNRVPGAAILHNNANIVYDSLPSLKGKLVWIGKPPGVTEGTQFYIESLVDPVSKNGAGVLDQAITAAAYPSTANLQELRVLPTSPASKEVYVSNGGYTKPSDGSFNRFFASITGFNAHDSLATAINALTSGQHQIAWVCLDYSTGKIEVVTGTATTAVNTVGTASARQEFINTAATSISGISVTSTYKRIIPLYLYYGQTQITEDDHLRQFDARLEFPLPAAYTAGSSGIIKSGGSVDNAVPKAVGTTGLVQEYSGVLIDDSNNVTIPGSITQLSGSNWKPTTDGTAALNVANAAGTALLTFDTTNGVIKPVKPIQLITTDTVVGGALSAFPTPLSIEFNPTVTSSTAAQNVTYNPNAAYAGANLRILNFIGLINGSIGSGSNFAAGIVGDIRNGLTSGTINQITGAAINVRNTTAGVSSIGVGVASIFLVSGTGNITSGYDFQARAPSFSSTGQIVTHRGFYAENMGNALTTNSYAFYADNQSGSTSGNYAIFTNTGTVQFGDTTIVGTPGASTARLNINAAASGVGVIVRANASSPGDVIQWQNSSGTVMGGVSSTGSLMVGTSTPTYKVTVLASSTLTSGTDVGTYSSITVTSASASSANIYGMWGLATSLGAQNYTSSIRGFLGSATAQGSGNVNNLHGGFVQATVNSLGSGTITNAYGLYSQVVNGSSTTGVITNGVLFYGQTHIATATITNAYGLYLESINTGATLNYAIYTNSGKLRFGDSIEAIAKITTYNNIATEGYGVPAIVDLVALTGQTANITTTNCTNANAAGLYRVSAYLQCTTADGAAGSLALTFTWTDDVGSTTSTLTQLLSATGRQSSVFFVRLASGNLTYATAVTGSYGTSQYAVHFDVERVN